MMSKATTKTNAPRYIRVGNAVKHIEFDQNSTGRELYLDMLKYRRPYDSATEKMFTRAVGTYINQAFGHVQEIDSEGNIFVTVGDNPTSAFTAHTDTCHSVEGIQTIGIDSTLDHAIVNDVNSSCLGADDASGIIIMLEMMRANVSGVYCFFRGEEVGGIGSSFAANQLRRYPTNHALTPCTSMISFDRRGYSDVITSQAFGECSSITFATELAEQLNTHGLQYKPDDTGIYTDSAEFVELISECTNVSVGYDFEHTIDEFQDLGFLFDYLIPVCIKLDTSALPIIRDHTIDAYGSEFGYTFGNTIDTSDVLMDNATEMLLEQCLDSIRSDEVAMFLKQNNVSVVDFISFCANRNIISGVM